MKICDWCKKPIDPDDLWLYSPLRKESRFELYHLHASGTCVKKFKDNYYDKYVTPI